MRPTPEQAKAIEARGRDVLLEAGAGTGKTGVMVERYCRLLCEEGVSPDAVLAFTFTDKAAAELRQRIHAEESCGREPLPHPWQVTPLSAAEIDDRKRLRRLQLL